MSESILPLGGYAGAVNVTWSKLHSQAITFGTGAQNLTANIDVDSYDLVIVRLRGTVTVKSKVNASSEYASRIGIGKNKTIHSLLRLDQASAGGPYTVNTQTLFIKQDAIIPSENLPTFTHYWGPSGARPSDEVKGLYIGTHITSAVATSGLIWEIYGGKMQFS